MSKIFNVTGDCKPELHYMVDIRGRLVEIKGMVDRGDYFTINRARQYGKTTTLKALARFLERDYLVVSLDFQTLDAVKFANSNVFSLTFAEYFLQRIRRTEHQSEELTMKLDSLSKAIAGRDANFTLYELFVLLSAICREAPKPIVLIIDEVDSATNNQVFLDFLGQLRGCYLNRDEIPTFQSVILAGVYDVKNIKRKIRPEDDHKTNSPWNIAVDFDIDMSFSAEQIAGMLGDYEEDHKTGMNIGEIAKLIYDYTSGYPFLVSRICKLLDEKIAGSEEFPDKASAWTKEGVLQAVNMLLAEKNTLFESLAGKLSEYPELKSTIATLLFKGQKILYNPDDDEVDMALMFGFVKVDKGSVVIANRIFETRLYNMFLTAPEEQNSAAYRFALQNKNQFIDHGHLDMEQILKKFVTHFDDLYGDQEQTFLEEDGRRYFLLYLRPIINGSGNYYIESRTRNMERTDVIVDYHGEQFVIEMKIWRGNAYNTRGEDQLTDYLNYYHLKKGYMLSFNFNKKKEIGVKEIALGDKILVEAVV